MADDEDIPTGATEPPAEQNGTPPEPPREATLRRFVGEPTPGLRRWWRHLPPLAGLLVMLGCAWGLLSGGPLPAWQPWWLGGNSAMNSANVTVVIDPGHGGGDSGAVAHGMVEKELNLDVGKRVAHALQAHGVIVRLTREDDHFVPLAERVRMANALPGAIFVSIHFNDASGDGKAVARASGIETFYSESKDVPPPGWVWTSLYGGVPHGPTLGDEAGWAIREGQSLADAIQGSLISGTAAADRGIKERSLYVTRRVLGPAVLVEGGFVSHPAEARLLGEPAYRQRLADSVAAGILRYLQNASRTPPPGTVAAVRAGG